MFITIRAKCIAILVLFISTLIAMSAFTVESVWDQKQDAVIMNYAGRQRMLTQRFAKEFYKYLVVSKDDNQSAEELLLLKERLKKTAKVFEMTLAALMKGGKAPNDLEQEQFRILLPINDASVQADFLTAKRSWYVLKESVENALASVDAGRVVGVFQISRITALEAEVLKNMHSAVQNYADMSGRRTRRQVIYSFLAGLVGVSLLIALSIVFVNGLLRPISQLSEAAERVGAGERNVYVGEDIPGELGVLASTFNSMTKKTAGFHMELERQVIERTEQLDLANKELERKNKELDEFTYIASHDLQEPVRKLTSFSSLLVSDMGGDLTENARTDLYFITDAAKRMQSLIGALLQLSRSGRSDVEFQTVSLNKCVRSAISTLSQIIEETGTKISHWDLPEVRGEPTMLTQLYQNLISNAVKFSAKGNSPFIEFTCKEQDGECVLGVKDNGIGISPGYCEVIFEPFKRLHGHDEYSGTGIGLAICRKTVERHGGRLWVESVLGEGSHFKFTLYAQSGMNSESA